MMMGILEFISNIGEFAVFITPLTLVVGIINAIKKPEGESKHYTVMAIVSAYLIIIPLLYNSIMK